ncbi:hypothetical protein D9M68_978070 [compost metagenome]
MDSRARLTRDSYSATRARKEATWTSAAEEMRDSSYNAGLVSSTGWPGLAAAAFCISSTSLRFCSSNSLIRRRVLITSGCCSVYR